VFVALPGSFFFFSSAFPSETLPPAPRCASGPPRRSPFFLHIFLSSPSFSPRRLICLLSVGPIPFPSPVSCQFCPPPPRPLPRSSRTCPAFLGLSPKACFFSSKGTSSSLFFPPPLFLSSISKQRLFFPLIKRRP